MISLNTHISSIYKTSVMLVQAQTRMTVFIYIQNVKKHKTENAKKISICQSLENTISWYKIQVLYLIIILQLQCVSEVTLGFKNIVISTFSFLFKNSFIHNENEKKLGICFHLIMKKKVYSVNIVHFWLQTDALFR